MNKGLTLSITLILLLTTSGCHSIYSQGHSIEKSAIDEIKDCKANKEKVVEALGTPEIISDITPNKWYYIQRTTTNSSLTKPKVTEQSIIEVVFDDHNLVQKINFIQNGNIENVTLVKEYTPTYGTESSSIKTYLGNLGKFRKSGNVYSKKRK